MRIPSSFGLRLVLVVCGLSTLEGARAQNPVPILQNPIPAVVQTARTSVLPLLMHRCRSRADSQQHDQCVYRIACAVAIDSGLFLASSSVAQQGSRYEVVLGSRHLPVQLIGTDPWTGLCLLRAETPDPSVVPLTVAEPAELAAGSSVVVLGFSGSFLPQVGLGLLGGVGPSILGGKLGDYLQFNPLGPLPGQGAAVLDPEGRLLGFLPAIQETVLRPAFALPADKALMVGRELAQQGQVRRPWIGMTIEGPDLTIGHLLGPPKEAPLKVARIESDSPASQAGVQLGDRVLGFDQQPVRTLPELVARLEAAGVGHTIQLRVERQGQPVELQLRIGERSAHEPPAAKTEWLGMDLAAEIIQTQPDAVLQRRVIVRKLVDSALASGLGFQVGDIVVSLNGQPVDDVSQFEGTAWLSPPEGRIRVEILRANEAKTLEFPALDVRSDPGALMLRLLRLEHAAATAPEANAQP